MTKAQTLERPQTQSLPDILVQGVRLGLGEFVQHSRIGHQNDSHTDNHILPLLNAPPLKEKPLNLSSWSEFRQLLKKRIQIEPDNTPLGQFIQDYQLSDAQLFIVFLLGEVEVNHVVGLTVAELQAPNRDPPPSLHLLSSLVNILFFDGACPWSVMDIAEQALVQQKLLLLSDAGPLATQCLGVSPYLYSVLINRRPLWEHCQPIEHGDFPLTEAMTEQTKMAVETLGLNKLDGVIVRANPFSGREQFAWHLAKGLGLQAVKIPEAQWRAHPELAAVSRYGRWLPVLSLQLVPGETYALPRHPQQPPVCIILDSDGNIADASLLEISLALPTLKERADYWHLELVKAQTSLSLSITSTKTSTSTNTKTDDVSTTIATQHTLAQAFTQADCQVLAESALLSARSIHSVVSKAKIMANNHRTAISIDHIKEARNQFSAEKLKLLAQAVPRKVTKDALVMPLLVEETLEGIVLRTQKRDSLWQGLGSTLKATPSPGVRVLFVGESGTGKTLAASYVSTCLAAPLYRVDLSSVMNKYIGESEKNLSQLLDYAAASDVVLLFDEADALFGSRSEGKETGERYANMLTNFLLTRIENHPGIVILTTNSRERIDNAFTRRIDMVVEFPLPGFEQRLHLWRSHLGDRGPGEPVYRTLASYCDLSGGQIRNAVLSAAVFSDSGQITEHNLIAGLRLEYQKIGRDLPGKVMQLTVA